jgi:hypothetical protein
VHWSHARSPGIGIARTTLLHHLQPALRADVEKMLKTFSISALFFMTVGVLFATHAALPF